ncbi:MAG: hypothetical protein MZV70_46845 [Desulfobacterales bacterium]|nr:hypothetical protein [Desulfobacterales bacterium]
MYSIINQHADLLIKKISPSNDVEPYVWLMDQLHAVDVTQDAEFRHTYRNYWRLNAARLSEGYVAEYFRCMEDFKRDPESATVESVLESLRATPTHRNGRKSMQFSLATKLVHMLRPDFPVYDSFGAELLLPPRSAS